MKKTLLTILIAGFTTLLLAQPQGYYNTANGKSASVLKTAMHEIIRQKFSLDYDGFSAQYWGDVYFKKTDWHTEGYYWDMYSNEQRAVYNSSAMSREHCMPRSWWGTTGNYGSANNDIHNLYPADYAANSRKSNLPLGEVGIESWSNGVVKVGQNTYPGGYNGTVFEPADQFKGDFARTYFYMVTCYEDYSDRWKNEGIVTMLNIGETYPVFKNWAIDMLLEWSRTDPVDQKEIDRNEVAFGLQLNRNPFIDFPELAEYIWGNKNNEVFNAATTTFAPIVYSPVSGTELDFMTTSTFAKSRYIPVKGANLTKPLNISLSGTDAARFSVSDNVVLPSQADTTYFITVSFNSPAEGIFNAVLNISSDEITQISIILNGSYTKNTVVDPVEPDEDMDVIIFYKGPWKNTELPANFQTNITTNPYANGDMKFDNTGKYLIVTLDEKPELLLFALKPNGAWGDNENHIYVYESENSTSWPSTPIADFDNTIVVGNTYFNTPLIELNENTRAIKIEYKKVSQNVGLNNLIITRPIQVDISEDTSLIKVYSNSGNIYIAGTKGNQFVQIFDLTGQIVYQGMVINGTEVIRLNRKGIFGVRVNNKVYKVIIN